MRFPPCSSLLILLILPSPLKSTPPRESVSQDGRLSQHQAMPVASDGGSNEKSAKSPNENLTLAQLEETLQTANYAFTKCNRSVFFSQRNVNDKMKEAKGPFEDYEKRKEEWERLSKESIRIGEEWNANVTEAEGEVDDFNNLNDASFRANKSQADALKQLQRVQVKAAEAQSNLDKLKDVPNQRANLTGLIAAMDANAKNALKTEVDRLKGAVKAAQGVLSEKKLELSVLEGERKEAKCDTYPTSHECSTQLSTTKATEAIQTAQWALGNATADLEGPKEKHDNFDTLKGQLQTELGDLKVPSSAAINVAEENVLDFTYNVGNWSERAKDAEGKAQNLTAKLTKMLPAKEEAERLIKSPAPEEVANARNKAASANLALTRANDTKTDLEKQIRTLNAILQAGQKDCDEKRLKAKALQTRYETAKRKAERPEGPSGATVGGAVAGVVLLIVAFISIGICYKRKMLCFAGRKAAKGKEGAASMKTARETASQAPAAATPGAAQPPDQASARPTDSAAAKPGSDPNSARKTEPTQKTDPEPVPVLNLNTSAAANHLADELVSEPPEPTGQTTFKV